MLANQKVGHAPRFEQAVVALLLIVGMYYPTSIDGEQSNHLTAFLAFVALFSLFAYLVWKHGVRRDAAAFISLPIIIVIVGCTLWSFRNMAFDFNLGVFSGFSTLALVFSLDLREVRWGRFVNSAFVLVNLLNILCGATILIGSEWISDFLPKYYWLSHTELVPSMVALHKPILTFGIHSLAGFFIYLFFWLNWEEFKVRRSKLALFFALSYLAFLIGLTSFTSLAFALLALAQIGIWCWKFHRKSLVVAILCVAVTAPVAIRAFADEIEALEELPQLSETAFLNIEFNGPLSRYGAHGSLRAEVGYLFDHPFSPIGVARTESALDADTPSHFFVGDSGPLEYLVRGSVPLLFLVYFGLYRFLRNNLAIKNHAIFLFLVIIASETGAAIFTYRRTYFLLPFFVVYLNQIAQAQTGQTVHARQLERDLALSN